MTMNKTQFLSLSSIFETCLDEVILTYLLHFGLCWTAPILLPAERWKEFQQTEADQNLQQVSHDKQQTVLISHVFATIFFLLQFSNSLASIRRPWFSWIRWF